MKTINNDIEALRGFCALMVVLFHSTCYSMNGVYDFRSSVISYAPSGHLMVLIFFMLSGYVIGLTNKGGHFFSIKKYFLRRLTRLYPIYAFSILLTIFLFNEKTESIISTTFFAQNLFGSVLQYNQPLWSLNFEFIFYLTAIPVLKFDLQTNKIILILFLSLIFSVFVSPFYAIVEGYLMGFTFWMIGFALARHKPVFQSDSISNNRFLSLFLLLLACDNLNTIGTIFSKISLLHTSAIFHFDGVVSINDFSLLPFCIYAILVATGLNNKMVQCFTFFVFLISFSHLLVIIINGSFFKTTIFYLPGLFLVLSIITLFYKRPVVKNFSSLVYMGSISYAVYVLHAPLQQWIGNFSFFSGTTLTFIIRNLLLLTFIILVSHLLEKIIQPRIKTRLFRDSNRVENHLGAIVSG